MGEEGRGAIGENERGENELGSPRAQSRANRTRAKASKTTIGTEYRKFPFLPLRVRAREFLFQLTTRTTTARRRYHHHFHSASPSFYSHPAFLFLSSCFRETQFSSAGPFVSSEVVSQRENDGDESSTFPSTNVGIAVSLFISGKRRYYLRPLFTLASTFSLSLSLFSYLLARKVKKWKRDCVYPSRDHRLPFVVHVSRRLRRSSLSHSQPIASR